MSGPTERTLRALREAGLAAEVVEKWIPPGKRKDLFGFVDVLALDGERGFIGIQVTTANCISERMRKLAGERKEEVLTWLATPGGRVELWGWRKLKNVLKNGKLGKGYTWHPRVWNVLADPPGISFIPFHPRRYSKKFR